jgi:putative membrane-bound dehydrogenase-like protein
MKRSPLFPLGLFIAASLAPGAEPQADPHALPRTPPLPPDQALAAIEVRPGLKLELVAAEPLVANPIAMSFDEEGRMFVVEMIDYGDARFRPRSRVRRLEDTNGDGIYDRASIYADNLGWASGLFCYAGGVFVAATPDLLYFRDADADGRAEIREVVYTGFGAGASPLKSGQLLNNFCWGPDNRIYVAAAGNAGRLRRPGAPESGAIDLRNKDFSFDPRTREIRLETGTAQYGQTFDDFGRRFMSSNHNHLQAPLYEYRYAERSPLVEFPRGLAEIAVDGGAAELFRISPEEPWRMLRVKWRAEGLVRGGLEAGGKTSGYFTSACGVTIYRGDALPPEFRGNAFVADPANNIAHRKLVRETGTGFTAERPGDETRREFIRARDLWFRPVNFATAPDGTLYIADMHRELIEDPATIPEGIVRHMDLATGNDRGRIYRVVPAAGFKPPAPPRLGGKSSAELAELLAHANGWMRDTASRLLYERQDPSAIAALEKVLRNAQPAARVVALQALRGLRHLQPAHLIRALADDDAHVREHAVRAAELEWESTHWQERERADLRQALGRRATDPSPRVRCQLAFSAAVFGGPSLEPELLSIARQGADDEITRVAVLSSLGERAAAFFALASADAPLLERPGGRVLIGQLIRLLGARANKEELGPVVSFLVARRESDGAPGWVNALGAGLRRSGLNLPAVDPEGRLDGMLQDAFRVAADGKAAVEDRTSAAQLVAMARSPNAVDTLLGLLAPSEPQRIQLEAVAGLARRTEADIASRMLERWPTLMPRVREDVVRMMLARPERARLLVEAVGNRDVPATDLSLPQQLALRIHADPQVQSLARQIFARAAANRQRVIEAFAPALTLDGDAARGRRTYAALCSSCHRLDGQGFELGPDLATVKSGGKEKLLTSILDPNREVDSKYAFYEIETREAGTILGTISDETPASITVTQAYGAQTRLPRASIVTMKSLGRSMMPEGLEASLSRQDVADLLEYILTAGD